MNRTLVLLNILLIIISCSNVDKGNVDGEKKITTQPQVTSEIVNLPNGHYYKFIYLTESRFRIEWGNESFINISKDTFDIGGSGPPYLLESTNDFIILQQSCGMSCKYSVLLPLTSQKEEQTYIYTRAIDSKNNLIAYLPDDLEHFVIVKNYLNGKVMEIEENDLCPAASSSDCIDTCYFEKSCLVIKWQGSNWQSNQQDTKERKIKITI
jgi:hypothetical protein